MKALYCVRDVVSDTYSDPIATVSQPVLIRSLKDVEYYKKHATDFQLFQCGDYDERTGCLNAYEQPRFVMSFQEIFRDEA